MSWEFNEYHLDYTDTPLLKRPWFRRTPHLFSGDIQSMQMEWWNEIRPRALKDLQAYFNEGWELVTAPGFDCFEVRTFEKSDPPACLAVALGLLCIVPTFGLSLLFLKSVPYQYVTPEHFRVQLRRQVR